MKQFIRVALSILLLTAMTACVGTSSKNVRVKCPACGYEFDVDMDGH